MYKPKQKDILFAKDVNDRLIATQTYNPNEMREAYRRLFGEDAPNQHFARSKVFAYFQYTYKAVDTTETAIPEESTSLSTETSTSSHSEEVDEKLMAEQFINDVKESGIVEKESMQIDLEEKEYKPKSRGRKKKTEI